MPNQEMLILLNTLHERYNHGLSTGVNSEGGNFFYFGNGEVSLKQVVNAMEGECTRRESIPSVLAQEILFQLCVESYGKLHHSKDAAAVLQSGALERVVCEWKGAVAAQLLRDELFDAEQSVTTQDVTLVFDGGGQPGTALLPGNNDFVKSIKDALPEKKSKSWHVHLAARKGEAEQQPLLQTSERVIAIPAANLNGFVDAAKHTVWLECIPWLIEESPRSASDGSARVCFGDPLPCLDRRLIELLRKRLEKCKDDRADATAIQSFQEEIDAYLAEEHADKEKLLRETEAVLLAALLLRDALESQLTIRQLKDRYYVYLEHRPLAYLDEQALLCLHNPFSYVKSHAYLALKGEVERLLPQSACQDVVLDALSGPMAATAQDAQGRYTISHAAEALKELLKQFSQRATETIPVLLKKRIDGPDERLEETVLSRFNYQFADPVDRPSDFFSQKLACFQFLSTQEEQQDESSFYHGSLISRDWYTLDSKRRVYLPLGVVGAHLILPMLFRQDTANLVDIQLRADREYVTVSVQKKVFGVRYELLHTYQPEEIIELDGSHAPAAGVWPDLADAGSWRDFYTYLYFPSNTYKHDAAVYYPVGQDGGTSSRMIQHTGPFSAGHEQWQMAQSDRFPLFIELRYDNNTAGVIPCAAVDKPQMQDLSATLSIDFGMSSTVGTFLPDNHNRFEQMDNTRCAGYVSRDAHVSPNDADFAHVATSGIAWQFNSYLGIAHSGDSFLSHYLGAVSDENPSGAVFTIVRRYYDLQSKQEDQPFIHGNIQFVGTSNLPANTSQIYSGLKIVPHLTDMREANIRLFLKQILEMYWLRCYQEGISKLDMRFAYPLAMDQEQQQNLMSIMWELCEELSNKTGIQLSALRMTNESKAVQTYYRRRFEITGIEDNDVTVTMDIGGGTTDFSIIDYTQQGKGQEPPYYSTTLAGNKLFAYRLYGGQNEAVRAQKERLLASRPGQKQLAQNNRGYFTLLIDQLLRNGHPELREMVTQQDSPIHHVLVFELCLLGWTASLLYQNYMGARSATQRKTTICLAGNGSRFYYLLDQETQELIRKVIAGGSRSFDIVTSAEQKMEVAKGLSLMDPKDMVQVTANPRLHRRRPDALQQDMEELWKAFTKFLRNYHKYFGAHSVVRQIADDKEQLGRLKKDFMEACHSLTDWVEYLPILCEKLQIAGGETAEEEPSDE